MIIPGGRFRESYYWDTYWIIKGMLACEMYATSTGVVQNLLDDVENFGFVPNGGRIYYLNRSQPPVLSDMVLEVFQATQNIEWLQKSVKTLDKEYCYWMNPKNNKVVQFSDGAILNRYFANTTIPRPESYFEDIETVHLSAHKAEFTYLQLATGAETGWDYSSRWLSGPNTNNLRLEDIIATLIVPADLNAILYRMEKNMARIHEYLELQLAEFPSEKYTEYKTNLGKLYFEASERRNQAINKWLYDSHSSCWRDFRIDTEEHSIRNSISNWVVPVWSGLVDHEHQEKKKFNYQFI
jgi:alpha,alpha-trehalase